MGRGHRRELGPAVGLDRGEHAQAALGERGVGVGRGDDPHPALEILLWASPAALLGHLDRLDLLLAG